MSINSGQSLSARYVLIRALGDGGTGEVWLARDTDAAAGHDALAAVKIYTPALAADAHFVQTLEAQLAGLRVLGHPGILRAGHLARDGSRLYLPMEYAPGGDLSRLRGRPWPELRAAVASTADALAAAHAAGLLHGDVKASNVLLAADGTPRVADFATGGAGSPYGMSPQRLEARPLTQADDVYALGVLIHELVTGHPPFYPQLSAERIRHEVPASLDSSSIVPPPLSVLVARCLAKAAEDRPTMDEAATTLRVLAAEVTATASRAGTAPEKPALTPPRTPDAPLRAEWQRAAPVAGPTAAQLRGEGFRRGLVVAAFAVATAAAGFVLFVLPGRMTPAPTTVVATATPASSAPAAAGEVDLQALAALKQGADDRLAALTPRRAALDQRAAETWGGDEWRQALTEMDRAAAAYDARDYATAGETYGRVAERFGVLEARAAGVLAEQLAAGSQALAAGQSGAARTAFELALKLAPQSAEAATGLKRAASLDEVMALLADGEAAEQDSRFDAALAAYEHAAQLDPAMQRAREGSARVRSRVAGDVFAAAMARGFRQLGERDYGGARAAFEKARGIRPEATEVQQALQQVEQDERTALIARRQGEAAAHEAAERWQQALDTYQDILKLDGTVAAAQEGVARATPRARLNDVLQLYVTQPERLFSAPVRDAARRTLAEAAAVTSPGPLLQQQIATLDGWLRRVEVPVSVALESDNLTRVTIYRVGDFGAFTRRAVELTPGTYTVVGTRAGYRDVRREIRIEPDTVPAPIVIRCEDQI